MLNRPTFNRVAFKNAMTRDGMSIREVARRIGVDPAAVIGWRDESYTPQLKHALALAALLGLRVEDLWTVAPQLNTPEI